MNDQLQALLTQFRSADLQGRIDASTKLAQLGEIAVDPLIDIVQSESALDLWWLAAQALTLIGDQRAVEPLVALLNNSLSHQAGLARKYTAYALAQFANGQAVDALIPMLHERDREEDDGTLFDEPDYETIAAAAGALVRIGDPRGIRAVLDRMLEGDFEFGDYLHEWGGETAFEYLIAALKTTNQEQHRSAAKLLGELRDPRAFSVLAGLFQTETDDDMRHGIMYGLSELHTLQAAPILLQGLTDPYDQIQLYAAFGIRYLILGNFPVPEEPDMKVRIKRIVNEVGETELITHLITVTQTMRPTIAAYAALFLEAFAPHVSPELAAQRIQPTLTALPDTINTWIQVEKQSLSLGNWPTG